MEKTYEIMIRSGVKVLSRRGMVTLIGMVITDATRDVDGSYLYTVAGIEYNVSAGCVTVL